jgi:LysR family transcriptional regulator, low CO2-responsive transcriptional regulator
MDAMITYHQLRTFVTAVRTGSLTRAARELHLTQPSLSLQLRSLTRYLDAPLFERYRGRLRLTPAGEKFRPYAEEALAGLRILQQDIESLNGRLAGPLAVGATYVMSRYVLPSTLARFLEQYPGIDLQLHVEFAEPLFGELSANALDIMCYIAVPTPPGLTTEVLGRDEFIVFASPRNPAAGHGRVTPRQLSQQPFVAPASPSLRALIETKLRNAGVTPRVAAEGRHHDTVKNLVDRHGGYSMLIRASVADELASGRFVALSLGGPPMTAELVAAFPSRPVSSPLVREFIQFVRADLNPNRDSGVRQSPRTPATRRPTLPAVRKR